MLHRWAQWGAGGVPVFEGANKLALIRTRMIMHVTNVNMHVTDVAIHNLKSFIDTAGSERRQFLGFDFNIASQWFNTSEDHQDRLWLVDASLNNLIFPASSLSSFVWVGLLQGCFPFFCFNVGNL